MMSDENYMPVTENLRRTRINSKILKFAEKFNIEFRVGPNLKSCKIVYREPPKEVPAAYFGSGVIFVRNVTEVSKDDMNIICLHELGHAILDLFPLTKKNFAPFEEVSANMIALSLAAQFRLPITKTIMDNFNEYNKITLKKIKGKK